MADNDVPVSDVLCEAMEYLAKLGSNLRSRSETLKEKKIRKDKLKNAHAVQKAANKVLLICELSKKSLDNVESGVKKILDIVDATQASSSDGGKTFTRVPNMTSSAMKNQFHYIEYQSKKLKIAKKISVKHFTSAKVKVKRMSMSKHDRYPVYHDCKLYRIRKRKNLLHKNEETKTFTKNKERLSQQSSDEESDSDIQSRSEKLRTISDDERNKDSSKEEYNDHEENTKSNRVDIDSQDSEKSESKLGAKKRNDSAASEAKSTKCLEKEKDMSASKTSTKNKGTLSQQSSDEESDIQSRSEKLRTISDDEGSKDSSKEECNDCEETTKSNRVDTDSQDSEKSESNLGAKKRNDSAASEAKSSKCPEKEKDKSASRKEHRTHSHSSRQHKWDEVTHSSKKKFKFLSSEHRRKTNKRKMSIVSSESESESCKSSTKKDQCTSETYLDSDNGNHNENYETYSPRNKNDDNNAKLEEKRKESSSDIENTDNLEGCIKEVKHSEESVKFECNSYIVKKDDESSSSNIIKGKDSSDSESGSVKNSSKNEKRPHSEIRKKSKHNKHGDEGSKEDIENKNSDSNPSRNECRQKNYKSHDTSTKKVYRSQSSKQSQLSDELGVEERYKNLEEKSSKTHKCVEVIDDDDNPHESQKIDSDNSENNKDLDSKEESFSQEKQATNIVNAPESEDKPLQLQEDSSNDAVKCKEKENCEVIEEDKKEPQRPIIKCVSLNKLLKPDVLKKDDIHSQCLNKNKYANEIPDKEQRPKGNTAIKSSFKSDKTIKKAKNIRFQDEEEEEYWAQKREEVKAFESKTFVINILKMPIISVDFLQQHNLSKVTRNGKIICRIIKDADTVKCDEKSDDVKDSETQKDNSVETLAIDKVKSALLFDSDSEKSESSVSNDLANRTKSIMESLLNESDSDSNEIQGKSDSRNFKSAIQNKDIAKENLHKENSVGKPSETQKITLAEDEFSAVRENRKSSPVKERIVACPAKENRESSPTLENRESSPTQPNGDFSQCEEIKFAKDCEKITSVEENETLKENIETSTEMENNKLSITNQDCEDIAKSSLLNDSSSSSPKKSKDKLKTHSKSPKRKHIMESMHAKRMLLTYSSSSETEDEQLSNVIKEIKDSLLKGISSDEEISPKKTRKKLRISSDSDEDLTTRVKKRKKVMKSGGTKPNKKSDDDGSSNDQCQLRSKKMGRSREKASSSSSHNSDNRDDKDVHGLTNLKSLGKSRRRQDSSAEEDNSSSRSTKKNKMPKEPLIKGEGLLEIPITSDEGSGAESDAIEEDLPPVSLSGLNGSGIEHLAKDDLLGETDSESSNEKEQTEDSKKEDSETDENVKLKRRKAPAISSDSEAGSSRRKDREREGRISDFEDSEEDGSETTKRSKRKKKSSDSDGSDGSSNEGGKKKRRRIKQIDSDASGSDTENEGRNKHGRKNIRKVMGKNQLEEATKKAAREEKERMARIIERQKLYNNLEFDESGKPDEVVLDKVVLDFDPETKEPLIEVDRGLVKKLKPHQANGIKFMWDACFESVKRIKKDRGSGCILAHCMGLGKTLQVVSLTHTLLTHSDLTGVNRVLVVCPLSTVLNWVNEFRMWLKFSERDFEVDVYELSKYKQNSERAFQLSQWFQHGGVCVLGYEMFRNLSADNNKKFKKKMLRNFQESLVDPGPDLVVCDEGHLLKNEKTSLSQSMNRVKTHRRIVLTGTPLQNNLKEYYCMVQFVKPNLLGKYNEYLNRFVNPITNGQYTDSTEHDIRVMKRRSHVLHKMLDGAVQRRDYGVLAPFLPPKHEYVLFITLTEVQVKLYQHYLENYSRRPLAGKSSGFLFPDFQSLQRIWTHPLVLKYNSERYEIMQQKKREREEEDSEGSLVDFIDDDSTPEESSTEESSDDLSDVSDDSRKKSKKNKAKKNKAKEGRASTRRGTRANPAELDEEEVKDPEIVEVKNDNPTEWWMPLVTDDELEDLRHSHKLVLLFEILRQCEAIGDKLLVFSQSLYSLDLIEHFLGKVDEATQEGRIDEKLGGHVGSWSPGIDYFRLDGSTSCENRSIWCKNFNREDNPRARLFLISTRAGGLGINLVAANRVIIFDVSWNPSHDVQSIFRVYRFGQKKPCYIYRFLAMGTMEEKIYERQVTKQAISKRVIDEQQIDRHYAENDLAELYKFEPQPPSPRPVPLVPKDRFFAEMLKEHEALIYKFHEHDSLLENKEEETLSEEERKAAWEDFENEKNKPPPAAFPSWPMHNGMVPNLLAQQQQQLAYAALATMLRKDMPNLSDDQIRSMLPLIYGANPALMQKLSDMYKYTQPGMMNPAMMNPVMNAAGATGGMGGGGTSGLQYEPPWQRQQQQQQQMRLQQMMQQQQSQMGAKYYAGGLGSRDPVAMALQQQRAREIMLGERARPRGRPPLQPRLPAAPGDVVNLDSD